MVFAVLPADKLSYQPARPLGLSTCWQETLQAQGREVGRAPLASQVCGTGTSVWNVCFIRVLYSLLLNSGYQDVTFGHTPFKMLKSGQCHAGNKQPLKI